MMLRHSQNTVYDVLGRHPVHPFPARMAPGIALHVLGASVQPLRVLDPMMGSGTVLAVARSRGHRAIGFDIDPLAVLMARVWTTTIDAPTVLRDASRVLSSARRRFRKMTTGAAYPVHADDETCRFVRYWFDDYARRQLTALAAAIDCVVQRDTRDVLRIALSRLIIAKQAGASRAMDLSHSRPHRAFDRAPIKPFARFLRAVERVASNCPCRSGRKVGPPASVSVGDARQLEVPDESIDVVLTSPPYLNAIDYLRCSKFSLVWMGHTIAALRRLRSESIGSEASSAAALGDSGVAAILEKIRLKPTPPDRVRARLCRYVFDIIGMVGEVERVLKPGGNAVLVVGDCTVRGTFISNSAIVAAVADTAGLRRDATHVRHLPPNRRYLPPPSSSESHDPLGGRMRREVVLAFTK